MKPNHIYGILILVLFLFVAVSCSDSSSSSDSAELLKYGDTITINYGQFAVDLQGGLKIGFSDLLEDSRCPIGLMCYWEGNARVKLYIEDRHNKQYFDLNTFAGFTQDTLLNGFNIKLIDVLPYPVYEKSVNKESYSVQIKIE